MPTAQPPVIRASHLHKQFGAHAGVQDVSFAVAAGETMVLLGPSGCGKTTLLKLLNRLIEPDGGTVEINGRDARQQPVEALRRGIGYVIQQVGLLPHYTVAENVAVVPRLLGHAPAAIEARTTALLTRLHLPPARYAGQYPHQLSGGQQQRVGLARALAADPPIVLLDEPFGALDPLTRASIRREFRELEELRRKTVVLVTHDVTEAFELADRILLLDAGRVQQLGTPRELLFRPANDFVRRFFAAERLALQLRTLTLGDVFGDGGLLNPDFAVPGPDFGDNNPDPRLGDPAFGVNDPDPKLGNSAFRVNDPDPRPVDPNFRVNNPDPKLRALAFGVNDPDPGIPKPPFTARTTVHDALEALTAAGPAAARPFTLPQLMAAFGAALQREEDAWKR
ncbi:ATP-binding cassette domain-containing protein [Hymenobacter sp.]|uniref:ABC transporter ATP-binding protein n=1 Tax=Hymenobacter sp. TaxID=1898978 RepID=UPI00286A7803|nr:ATP-binding cassette domain-containing protein [Hymenobacter sp.]